MADVGRLGERRPAGLVIRTERADDADAVEDVVGAAFRSSVQPRLVAELRASPAHLPDLALVAQTEGRVVGHVMATAAHVLCGPAGRAARTGLGPGSPGPGPAGPGPADGRGRREVRQVVNLSPLSVAPSWQGRGIGSALVREVVARAERRSEAAVVLEGDPGYYGRLGFEPAARWGLHLELPAWAPPGAAQVHRLTAHDPSLQGQVVLPPPFREAAGR